MEPNEALPLVVTAQALHPDSNNLCVCVEGGHWGEASLQCHIIKEHVWRRERNRMTTAEIQETEKKKSKKLDISEVLLYKYSLTTTVVTTSDKIKKRTYKYHENIVNVVHKTPVLYLKCCEVL